jgi:LmbE family N-acetylglucosaminyl deacetylase
MTGTISAIYDKSIIIVAHPDDEILWLSSILQQAERIVFCFQDCASAPKLGPGRNRLIAEYPLSRVETLGIEESLSFNSADWRYPALTEYGIRISNSSRIRKAYERNYHELIRRLTPIVANHRNVFTHNPWGEYGHEDHIQVYRALRKLQETAKFNLWFSNYCSEKSTRLMMKHVSGFSTDYITLPTNLELAESLKDLYKKYGCWTWYKDYQWFKEESLMTSSSLESREVSYGHLFPINMVKTDFDQPGAGQRFLHLLNRMFVSADNSCR